MLSGIAMLICNHVADPSVLMYAPMVCKPTNQSTPDSSIEWSMLIIKIEIHPARIELATFSVLG